MRLVSVLLSFSMAVFATPGAAAGPTSSDPALSTGPEESAPVALETIEGGRDLERHPAWRPTSFETFLAQRSLAESDQVAPTQSPIDREIAMLQKEKS